MTELNSFHSTGSLPIWALPNAPDMMKWQWQPPKPELWSPPLEEDVVLIQTETCPQLVKELEDMHKIQFKSSKKYKTNFEMFVHRFKEGLSQGKLMGPAAASLYVTASNNLADARQVLPKLGPLHFDLMCALSSGFQSARELNPGFCISWPLFWEVLLKQLARVEVSMQSVHVMVFVIENIPRRLFQKELNTVVSALNSYLRPWGSTRFSGTTDHWDEAEIVSMSNLASVSCGHVNKLLDLIQSYIASGQLQKARTHLAMAMRQHYKAQRFTQKKAHLISDDQQVTKAIAGAINPKSYNRWRFLINKMTAFWNKSDKNWSRKKYNWLQTLVQIPNMQKNDFKRALELFPRRGHAALSHTELCHLLLLHWHCRGILKDRDWIFQLWTNLGSRKKHLALAALALTVNKTTSPKACTGIFWEFWGILRVRAGRKTLLKQLSGLCKSHRLTSNFLQRLAWTSNDHRVVALVHDILTKQTGETHHFWWPSFWGKFIPDITEKKWTVFANDPIKFAHNLSGPRVVALSFQQLEQQHNKSMKMTGHPPLAQQIAETHGDQTQERAEKVRRIKRSLALLVNARQITNRQALRHVVILTKTLAKNQGHLSANDLSTLTSVIMRILNQGKCGDIGLIRWYLGIIYTHLGQDACYRVGLILKRRRWENWHQWQRSLSQANSDSDQPNPGELWISGTKLNPRARLWKTWVSNNRRKCKRHARRARLALAELRMLDEKEQAGVEGVIDNDPFSVLLDANKG